MVVGLMVVAVSTTCVYGGGGGGGSDMGGWVAFCLAPARGAGRELAAPKL